MNIHMYVRVTVRAFRLCTSTVRIIMVSNNSLGLLPHSQTLPPRFSSLAVRNCMCHVVFEGRGQ